MSDHLERLQRSGDVQNYRSFDVIGGDSSREVARGFDASWLAEDGVRVRGRLLFAPEKAAADLQGELVDFALSKGTTPISLSWALTAESDRPWNLEWNSPLLQFFPERESDKWGYDSLLGALPMREFSTIADEVPVEQLSRFLDELANSPWYTTVITHDRRSQEDEQAPTLVDRLPPGLMGRVLELRAHGDWDAAFNQVLAKHRVTLPWGGAVVLPSSPLRKEGWPSNGYEVNTSSGLDTLLQKTTEHVTRYCSLASHYPSRVSRLVEEMRASWVLPEAELASSYVMGELDSAQQQIGDLRAELEKANRRIEEYEDGLRQAQEAAGRAQATLLETVRRYEEDPLAVRAAEQAAQAEEAFAGQEAAEAVAEDLAAEVAWLRRQLALVPGRSYAEEAPARPRGPESWQELEALARELLSRVRLGDVQEGIKGLAGHVKESSWIRRTWEALEALEAYGEAGAQHGRDVLPHFSAYLNWPGATSLVPLSFYGPKESSLLNRDVKYRRLRTFFVPDLGEVLMTEHFRIGGNRPPAPRMHVHDDLHGPTGLIHVGYIGPHLPNGGKGD
ncbi:hypothetical protein [Streptomyces sp. NPDC088752]|uniref:hypothetical protein n=1 Tax=Streptomyces sp. NPDC088752 TaxID=3154963 RepID=UPI0034143168